MLHECQVAVYADLGCTDPFAYDNAKSNPCHNASDVPGVQLHS
jgi:hypothetical protein